MKLNKQNFIKDILAKDNKYILKHNIKYNSSLTEENLGKNRYRDILPCN